MDKIEFANEVDPKRMLEMGRSIYKKALMLMANGGRVNDLTNEVKEILEDYNQLEISVLVVYHVMATIGDARATNCVSELLSAAGMGLLRDLLKKEDKDA